MCKQTEEIDIQKKTKGKRNKTKGDRSSPSLAISPFFLPKMASQAQEEDHDDETNEAMPQVLDLGSVTRPSVQYGICA